MFDCEQILESYDFHMFIMERRDGSHFVGNLYKTKGKAESVAMTYINDDPELFRCAHVFKVGTDPSQVTPIFNPAWIDDEEKAKEAKDEQIKEFHKELMGHFEPMIIQLHNTDKS